MSTTTQDERLIKVARMEMANVSAKQIAGVLGVSEGGLSQIRSSEAYLKVLANEEQANFEQQDLVNRGWDGVEETAIGQVLTHLAKIPDPDFALKAAAVANKAVRRGKHTNDPIIASSDRTVVVQMNTNFIGQLENNYEITKRDIGELPQHSVSTMGVAGVKSLLQPVAAADPADIIGELDLGQ